MKKSGSLVALCGFAFVLSLLLPFPGASASAKEIQLIFADMAAPTSVTAKCVEWWGSAIEKKTHGKVKIQYNWSASLVGTLEQLDSVKNNVIQLTPYYAGYHPDVAPLPVLALLPMLDTGPLQSGLKAADEFFRTNQEVKKEFTKNNVKYMNPLFSARAYMWSKVPINTLSDFNGLTVRAFGPWLTLFAALGSSMVSVPGPEIYNSLERGVVKATVIYFTYGIGMNLFEVTKYINVSNLGHNFGMPLVMNLDTWNSLPDDVKKAIEDVNSNATSNFARIDKANFDREMGIVKDKGMTISEFSATDLAKLKKIAREKVWEPYAKKLDEKGLNGTKVLGEYLKLVESNSP